MEGENHNEEAKKTGGVHNDEGIKARRTHNKEGMKAGGKKKVPARDVPAFLPSSSGPSMIPFLFVLV
jgi:hypothetical protein